MALLPKLIAPGKSKLLDQERYQQYQAAARSNGVAPGSRAGIPGWAAASNEPSRVAPGTRARQQPPARQQQARYDAEKRQEQEWGMLMAGRRGSGGVTTTEISDEDYEALNPNQRAAVDFNTAYMRAVNLDRARGENAAEPDSVARQQYAELAREMFGEREGEAYSPNVVALLDSVGYRAPGANTDDLAEGLGGISQRELDFLGGSQGPDFFGQRRSEQSVGVLSQIDLTDRQAQLAALAQGTRGVIETLRQTEQTPGSSPTPLSLFAGTSFSDRVGQYITERGLGIGETRVETMETEGLNQLLDLSYTPPGENPIYHFAFQDTINKANSWTPELLYDLLREAGADPAGFPAYVEDQLRRYEEATGAGYNVTLGRDPSTQTYSPEEYRQLLGIQVG